MALLATSSLRDMLKTVCGFKAGLSHLPVAKKRKLKFCAQLCVNKTTSILKNALKIHKFGELCHGAAEPLKTDDGLSMGCDIYFLKAYFLLSSKVITILKFVRPIFNY